MTIAEADNSEVLTDAFTVCALKLDRLPIETRRRVLRAINALFQEPQAPSAVYIGQRTSDSTNWPLTTQPLPGIGDIKY